MSLDKCPQKWREVGSGQMSKHVTISKGFWCEGVVNRSLVRLTLVILINPKNGGNMHTLDVHADVHAGVHLWCAFPIGLRGWPRCKIEANRVAKKIIPNPRYPSYHIILSSALHISLRALTTPLNAAISSSGAYLSSLILRCTNPSYS